MAAPTAGMRENPFRLKRDSSSFSSKSSQFKVSSKNFERQFSHIYTKRLEVMKPRVQEHMKAVWPETKVVPRVIDLAVGNVQWAFAGTVYKNMKLKPCVLDEFTNGVPYNHPFHNRTPAGSAGAMAHVAT